MKKIVLYLCFMLIMVLPLLGEAYEQTEEYAEKQAILNEKAARFKADTGFRGEINYGYDPIKLGSFYGKFADIQFSAGADTTAYRQVCNLILDKIMPYSFANRSQLSMVSITEEIEFFKTEYYQVVNGFQVDIGGFIGIMYDFGSKRFFVGNNTVKLPININISITREEATNIAVNFHKNKINPPEHKLAPYVEDDLRFCNPDATGYALKYIIYIGDFVYYVDASTGQLDWVNAIGDNLSTFTIKGRVYNPYDPSITPAVFSDSLSMRQIQVKVNGESHYTNDYGETSFQDSLIQNFRVNMKCNEYYLTDYSDSLNIYYSDVSSEYSANSNMYTTVIDDSCKIGAIMKLCHASNTYYHAKEHIFKLESLSGSYNINNAKLVTNFCFSDPNQAGQTTYNPLTFRLRTGLHQSIIRHELSHHFTYRMLGSSHFVTNNTQGKAMSESFAHYLSCSTVPTDILIYPSGNSYVSLSLRNNSNISIWGQGTLNEDSYCNYLYGFNIASAWWSLRSNQLFLSDLQGRNGFDMFLIRALAIVQDESTFNTAYRYKPRYFYNILMNNSTSAQQLAIDKAYSDRGFQFTPVVISAGSANPQQEKNMFRIGDPVHVKVTNCPQNTPITVYIVQDRDYTDGMSTPSQSSIVYQTTGTTDNDGVWYSSTPVMTASTVGDYDILVDIGNNGVLHYAYNAANVHDGFDGLNGPGFKVFDDGIDVVLALDISNSMVSQCSNLQRLAKTFISVMSPGDKINIFGFKEGYNPDWYGVLSNISPTTSPYLYSITQENQASLINSVGTPSAGGWTDLYVPFFYGYHRFGSTNNRNKGMVLLSDGLHNPSVHIPNGPNSPPFTNPHRMYHVSNSIINNYNTRGIDCYTMRYGNQFDGSTNMSNIAFWGHGVAYQVQQLSDMQFIVSTLISRLRGNPPSFDNSYEIQPNSNQTSQIEVDNLADNLVVTLIWKTSGNNSLRSFTLTDPSGTIYSIPETYDGTTLKYSIPSPQSGTWTSNSTNNTSIAQSFSIISEIDSDLRVTLGSIPASHPVDQPLLLQVSVSNYTTPIVDAEIVVTIKKNDWQFSVNLYDDGNHNDGEAGDGQYANYLYAYPEICSSFPSYQQRGDFDLSFLVNVASLNGQRVVRQNLYLSPIYNQYPPVTRNLHTGWNWVGYPRLQRDEVGASVEYANVSLSPFLTDVLSADGIAKFRNNLWNYNGLTSLNSDDGYKLLMNGVDSKRLFELGTIIDTLTVHPLYEGQWNWYTYPCYETVYPWEALSDAIDRIDFIMAENWSMKKDGDIWHYDGFIRPHLKYGDSIMIRTTRDCSFIWNNPFTKPIIVDPRKPSYFTFDEKPDYETIMIESIEGDPDYTEIGVFQNNECIGARVYETYPIQILAYSTPEDEGGSELSFALYTEDKGTMAAIPVSNLSSSNHLDTSTIEPERQGFRRLTLKTDNLQIPPVLALNSNYPNPFNPSTTISFSLPTTSNVKLTVYNIKGQKVKELVNHSLACGKQSIVWNGRDDGDRPVSSGVYFVRLEHCGNIKINKMMLMK